MSSGAPSPTQEHRGFAQPLTQHCDLCGEAIAPHEFSQAALDASGLAVCQPCIEEQLSQ